MATLLAAAGEAASEDQGGAVTGWGNKLLLPCLAALQTSSHFSCSKHCCLFIPPTSPHAHTQAVTAGVLAGSSDLLAQRLSGGSINWRRTLAIALYGVVWSGPAGHFWQQALERLFPDRKDPLRSAKKVLLDQLTFGPLCNGLFLAFMAGVVEGRGWAGTRWAPAAHRLAPGMEQLAWAPCPTVRKDALRVATRSKHLRVPHAAGRPLARAAARAGSCPPSAWPCPPPPRLPTPVPPLPPPHPPTPPSAQGQAAPRLCRRAAARLAAVAAGLLHLPAVCPAAAAGAVAERGGLPVEPVPHPALVGGSPRRGVPCGRGCRRQAAQGVALCSRSVLTASCLCMQPSHMKIAACGPMLLPAYMGTMPGCLVHLLLGW